MGFRLATYAGVIGGVALLLYNMTRIDVGHYLVQLADLSHTDPVRLFLVFVSLHAVSILLCLPSSMLFELGAPLLFRGQSYELLRAYLLVTVSKCAGGLLSFFTARYLLRDSIRSRLSGNKYIKVLIEARPSSSLKLGLLLRLSPVPSYVATVGLATFTQLNVGQFALLTVLGGAMSILNNVLIGSTLVDLTAASLVSAGGSHTLLKMALLGTSIISSILIGKKAYDIYSSVK